MSYFCIRESRQRFIAKHSRYILTKKIFLPPLSIIYNKV